MDYNNFRFQEYSLTTDQVTVKVVPEYLVEDSKPEESLFSYAYTVSIENMREEPFQLINRHWKVFENQKQSMDIKGEGVIGVQPLILPRDVFQYSSGVQVKDSISKMEGAYTCLSKDGNFFDIIIPAFDLIYIEETQLH